eukprot:429508_1
MDSQQHRDRKYSFDGSDENESPNKTKTKRSKKRKKHDINGNNIRSKSIPRKRNTFKTNSVTNLYASHLIHINSKSKRKIFKEQQQLQSTDLIHKIDQMLEIYYISLHHYDYNHKFKIYCKENNINDRIINTDIIHGKYRKSMQSLRFDDNFPTIPYKKRGKKRIIFKMLKYCALYSPNISNKIIHSFKLSWNHIINMIKHYKGSFIADSIRNIITENNIDQYDLSHHVLNKIIRTYQDNQNKHEMKSKDLSKGDIDNLRNIIVRGILFSYFRQFPLFTMDYMDYIEQDIFDVYRMVLLAQNRMEEYTNNFQIK